MDVKSITNPSETETKSSTATCIPSTSYLIDTLLHNVPVVRGHSITSVEIWNANVYIGTSNAEIMHFVGILGMTGQMNGAAGSTYVLASRILPPVLRDNHQGVQQMIVMPSVEKLAVLCNQTLSFFTLPELSPAFSKVKPFTCTWVEGVNAGSCDALKTLGTGDMILLSLRHKIRLVRVAEEPVLVRDIEFGGSLLTFTWGGVACVANLHSYTLVDIVNQLKIPLFSISSCSNPEDGWPYLSPTRTSSLENNSRSDGWQTTQAPNVCPSSLAPRSSSSDRKGRESDTGELDEHNVRDSSLSLANVHSENSSSDTSWSPHPLIASSQSGEFLLLTGSTKDDSAVGIFVNLDGEVSRGTVEFNGYPNAVVIDMGLKCENNGIWPAGKIEDAYIIAALEEKLDNTYRRIIEVQQWPTGLYETNTYREYIEIGQINDDAVKENLTRSAMGLKCLSTGRGVNLVDISLDLAKQKLHICREAVWRDTPDKIADREKEELEFVKRICSVHSNVVCWSGKDVYTLVKKPWIVQLIESLNGHYHMDESQFWINVDGILELIERAKLVETHSELDVFGITFFRQKISLLLIAYMLYCGRQGDPINMGDVVRVKDMLINSEPDPRLVLALVREVRMEIMEGERGGIWVNGGLKHLIENFLSIEKKREMSSRLINIETWTGFAGRRLLIMIREFLEHWNRKKVYGSIEDREEVFATTDGAILHIYLLQEDWAREQGDEKEASRIGNIIVSLIEDKKFQGIQRAVEQLEERKMLYTLTRLYAGRNWTRGILATWKRILEGEECTDGERAGGKGLVDQGEEQVCIYLRKGGDSKLYREYGIWVANRKGELGGRVFADEHELVGISTKEALEMLRKGAPDAVKAYLERVVFRMKRVDFAGDLMEYYLSTVLEELTNSAEARKEMASSYSEYRGLRGDKPGYFKFAMQRRVDGNWWKCRIGLLRLAKIWIEKANVETIRATFDKIQGHEDSLVPEMVMAYSWQGLHVEAIRLLVSKLGDLDTAIRYSLRGGKGSGAYHVETEPRGMAKRDYERVSVDKTDQVRLFRVVLSECFSLDKEEERVQRTADLVTQFSGWFDVRDVLERLPDTWPVGPFTRFLISGMRGLREHRVERFVKRCITSRLTELEASEVYLGEQT